MTTDQLIACLALAGRTDIRLLEKHDSIAVEFHNGKGWCRNAVRYPSPAHRETAIEKLLEWAA